MALSPHLRTLLGKPPSITWTKLVNDPGSTRNAEIWIGVPGTSPSAGSISHLGDAGNYNASSSSLIVTTDSNVGANDVLILCVAAGASNTVSSVVGGTAGSNKVTVTMSGTCPVFANVARYSGLGSSSVASSTNTSSHTAETTTMPGPALTSTGAELLVSVGWAATPTSAVGAPAGTGAWQTLSISTSTNVGAAYVITTGVATDTTQWSLTGAGGGVGTTSVGACIV